MDVATPIEVELPWPAPLLMPSSSLHPGPGGEPLLQRVAVVSGRYPSTDFQSPANHRAYCLRHGYTYVHCNWPAGQRVGYLNKIQYVLHYFDLFDWIFWIDDDAFFVDLDVSLDRVMPGDGKFLSICSSPSYKEVFTVVSSGQFLIRTSDEAREFLIRVRDADLSEIREWWRPELGYFSAGDQDAIVHLMETEPQIAAGIDVHDYAVFNSRISDLEAGRQVFLVHFTGERWIKHRDARRAARILGTGPELLRRDVADEIHVKPKPTWARRQLGDLWRRFLRLRRRVEAWRP